MNEISYKQLPLQTIAEHDAFIDILVRENVTSYLEIGSMWGRSLWRVANRLPKGSTVVAIDSLSDRPECRESLEACIDNLLELGYDTHFVYGDSTLPGVIDIVKKWGPYDALFIDGNHSPEYVMADWNNYGPMSRIVGFHDINWNNTWVSARGNTPPPDGSTMGAPKIWNELKKNYRHEEFKMHPGNNYHGIGVLWRC